MTRDVRRALALFGTLTILVLLLVLSLPGATSGAPAMKYTSVSTTGAAPNADLRQLIASCDEGYHVTGGGYEIQSINPAIFVHQDVPLGPESNGGRWGWAVTLLNETGGSVVFTVVALCERG